MSHDAQPQFNAQLASLRIDYKLKGLTERDVDADPLEQFHRWFIEAATAGLREPNSMTLATVDEDGVPDARIVLLKALDEKGFAFYTNYESAKARQLSADPAAALVFFWNELERQVRVRGSVEKISVEESAKYFKSRPLESQLSAWSSKQSHVIPSRAWLEESFAEIEGKFRDAVPMPPFWGGYRLIPREIEFWQGRPNRLHDRLRYRLAAGQWNLERLAP